MDSDSIPVLLSPGAVICGRPSCNWSHVGGDLPSQYGALIKHIRAEHQSPSPAVKEPERCPPSA